MSAILKIILAALIVMAGLIFLCFVLSLCKAASDEDERTGCKDRRDEHD